MKKQKAPLALIAGLIIVGGATAVFNAAARSPHEHKPPQMQGDMDDGKLQGQQRASLNKSDLAAFVKENAAKKHQMATPVESGGNSPSPTILLPTMADYKPQINDAAPSIIWYDKDSRMANKKDPK